MCEDKQESVELWIDQFNDWCTLQDWRDLTKDTSDKDHWKDDCYGLEISAFRLALPLTVWRTVKSTVVPTMTNDDNENTSSKRPWVWQKKLLAHYSGQDTVLSNRMTFMETCKQKGNESIADFEARCKYLGSKCEYDKMTNPEQELIRDRFVTGVHDDKLCAELLRHKKDDGSVYKLSDVINKAKAWEAANKTNTQVMESQHTEEQVNYTAQINNRVKCSANYVRNRSGATHVHNRKAISCGYCGAPEMHPRKICPAAKPGVLCRNCYGDNHFASVCRNPKDKFKQKHNKQVHSLEQEGESSDEFTHDYALSVDSSSASDVKKLLVELPLSLDGTNFQKVTFQVDTAASCNTLPLRMFSTIGNLQDLSHSKSVLHSYSGNMIKPLGRCTLLCESEEKFDTIDFEVIDDVDVVNKPGLLGIKDSVKLGLIQYDNRVNAVQDKYDVFSVMNNNPNSTLQKETILKKYHDVFHGVGDLGKPVTFVLNPNIVPVHAPVHRIPLSKRKRTKEKIDEMVKVGKLAKVNEPTDWCSNMTVVEKIKPNGQIKTRICIDPSQTINKALIIPKYTIPTLQEILPEFSSHKYKTFTIVDALDGFTQVKLDKESSEVTTMSTPWGDINGIVSHTGFPPQ